MLYEPVFCMPYPISREILAAVCFTFFANTGARCFVICAVVPARLMAAMGLRV